MKNFLTISILTVFAMSLSLSAGNNQDTVQKKYKIKVESLKKQYEIGIEKIKKQMIKDYEVLLRQKMRSGYLKAANDIQMKIDILKKSKEKEDNEFGFDIGIPQSPIIADKLRKNRMFVRKNRIEFLQVIYEYAIPGKSGSKYIDCTVKFNKMLKKGKISFVPEEHIPKPNYNGIPLFQLKVQYIFQGTTSQIFYLQRENLKKTFEVKKKRSRK
jgi:hypothetical protein